MKRSIDDLAWALQNFNRIVDARRLEFRNVNDSTIWTPQVGIIRNTNTMLAVYSDLTLFRRCMKVILMKVVVSEMMFAGFARDTMDGTEHLKPDAVMDTLARTSTDSINKRRHDQPDRGAGGEFSSNSVHQFAGQWVPRTYLILARIRKTGYPRFVSLVHGCWFAAASSSSPSIRW